MLLPAEFSKGEPRTDWSVWSSDSKSDMEALSGNVSSDISRLSDVPVISLMLGYLVCCSCPQSHLDRATSQHCPRSYHPINDDLKLGLACACTACLVSLAELSCRWIVFVLSLPHTTALVSSHQEIAID